MRFYVHGLHSHGLCLGPLVVINTESETSRLSLWRLDSEVALQPFLQFALSRDNVADAAVVITLDMSRPWSLMHELEVSFRSSCWFLTM